MNEFNIVELLVDVALIWIISYTKSTAEVTSFRKPISVWTLFTVAEVFDYPHIN